MYKNKYSTLAFLNFILGVCAICLYLPYTIEAFNIKGFGWLDFAKDILKENYFDVLIYFGIFLLAWFIALNVLSIISHINLPKFLFKVSVISSLILPLIYVLGLKYDGALNFWIDTISKNVKMISYILLCISLGSFVLALIFNFTKRKRANLHHITQSLVMCALLILFVAIQGWCGWNISNMDKLFGILMGLFAIYLPISTIILSICAKNR